MKTPALLITLFITLLTLKLTAQVQVPQLMNYQGQLANAAGTPLPTADYTLTFRIYDTPQAGSGTLIWGPQTFDGTTGAGKGPKIPVVQGYFNVMLGPIDTGSRPLSPAFSGSATRFVEIQVGTDAPVAPRQQLLSAPYAFLSESSAKLNGFDWSAILTGGVNNPSTGTLRGDKLAPGSITSRELALPKYQLDSTEFSTIANTPGVFVQVTGLEARITAPAGRPVEVRLMGSYVSLTGTGTGAHEGFLRFYRNGVEVGSSRLGLGGSAGKYIYYPSGSFSTIDFPDPGVDAIYTVQIATTSPSTNLGVDNATKLLVREL